MLMLIDTHDPPPPSPPDGERPPRTWPRVVVRMSWRLVAAFVLVMLSNVFPPLEAYAVLLAACVLIGRGLAAIVPHSPGLRDHRQ